VYRFPPLDESVDEDDLGSSSQSSITGLQAQSFLPGYPFVNDMSGNSERGASETFCSGSSDGGRSVVGWDAAAANAAARSKSSNTDSIAGNTLGGGVRAIATANGGLSVPLLYGSVVVGLLVCNRYQDDNDDDLGDELTVDDSADSNSIGSWDPTEVRHISLSYV